MALSFDDKVTGGGDPTGLVSAADVNEIKAAVDLSTTNWANINARDFTFTGDVNLSGANSVTMGIFTFANYDYTPTSRQFHLDNTVTGLDGGCLCYHNGTEVRFVADVATLPDTEGQILRYDASLDKWVPEYPGPQIITITANTTLTAAQCYNSIVYVTGAYTVTLAAAADRMNLTVIVVGSYSVSIDPNASDKIVLDGATLDDGDKITSTGTTGDIAAISYYSADGFYAATNSWTDGGA